MGRFRDHYPSWKWSTTSPASPRRSTPRTSSAGCRHEGPRQAQRARCSRRCSRPQAAVHRVLEAARRGKPYRVTALAVHGVMVGTRDIPFRRRLNDFDLVVPDGQPVRWALNLLHTPRSLASSAARTSRSPCSRAPRGKGFLFSSTEAARDTRRKCASMSQLFPRLRLAGMIPSLFEPVDEERQVAIAESLRKSDAAIVFVGIGCPRQEVFVSALGEQVGVPMLAVGAAFDYLAGTLREPPAYLRRIEPRMGLASSARASPTVASLRAPQSRLSGPTRIASVGDLSDRSLHLLRDCCERLDA